jgi:hypothetical protein
MSEPPTPPADDPRARQGDQPGADAFRWQTLFQRAAEPLFLLNRRRRILFANAAWQALTGIGLREARTLVCKRYRSPEPGSREALLQALAPPAEALEGRAAWARRVVAQPGVGLRGWDITFLPFRGPDGLLGILGRITPEAAGPPAFPALPARLLALTERLARWHHPEHGGAETPVLRRLHEQMRLARATATSVLLLGEPGTGKEWTARAIHQQGGRGLGAFVSLDCRRLPAHMLGALLFEGGGLAGRPGVGTLYLREPQHLPRDLQARLAELAATAPGTGEGQRPGPRLVAGCSADPQTEVRLGRLLEELYCALGVLTIFLPPLRERQADFGWLARRLLERAADTAGGRPPGLTAEAWEVLQAWSWPGNLRELYAVLQTACGRAAGAPVEPEHLPWYLRSSPPPPARSMSLQSVLQDVERRLILLALKAAAGNKTRAARLLSVWRPLLLRRIKALGIEDPEA